ncbi:CHASE2 domain-containing protein [cf. Phormidesmis sp. LEGE 11477]|uniref:CHASE2 domain-containing protein n=1 Tax=cf. Phormidesmis sp. LEGE 11477 TaxID=1828680 RepID=UPI0018823A27|nr:CHASE2 domain-containing protein [cf. Phormidesmis sp. LEGE 11477]MBE9060779.1 CHASE2 domain-containing protein [cf. Phormidesmis sp. LEGE 11477]
MLGQTLIDRYKLTHILGSGGFGQTYLAVDVTAESQNALCVVKQLKLASQDQSFLKVARRLFQTEVDTLKKLGSHLHIPALLDSFEDEKEFYLVQEFVEGHSLEEEIGVKKKFTEAQAITLLEKVLAVLGFVHSRRVIHRDLKPDNLIRRKGSDDIALIDFGAVKQIRTRLHTGEKSTLTVGIGTQGYTPSEQLSGKPRYSSDIYALGMTVIHALTGRSPTDLPESPDTLEPQWQQYVQISPGLSALLEKMTRHYIYQRYQSVEEVQHDLNRLDELPGEIAAARTSLPLGMTENGWNSEAETVIIRWVMGRRAKWLTVLISTLLTSAFVLGARQMGVFVPAELLVWDRWVGAQADREPDQRLLVVEIAEEDLRSLQTRTPSDRLVAQAIDNLQQHNPVSIGVNLAHDVPHPPGTEALKQRLNHPEVVTIAQLGNSEGEVLAPAGLSLEQISLSDIAVDPDFRVRRALIGLAADSPLGQRQTNLPIFSLGTELALRYLESIERITPAAGSVLTLADTRFESMSKNFGGYQNIATESYQIPLQYRSALTAVPTVSFSEVLDNRFDPDLVRDKIVLIGMTATSGQDAYLTPYNVDSSLQKMPGTLVHAQVASQILSAVIDRDRLLWDWPEWAEIVWIFSLTATGSVLMVLTQKGPILIAFGVGGLLSAYLVSLMCFHAGGWVPVVTPMSAFFFSAAGARISKSYQRRHWEAHQ